MATNNQDALHSFASKLGIELSFNDSNIADVLINDHEVTLEGGPEDVALRINAVVGDLQDKASSASALKVLLQANFNGQGTGLSSLGLDHVSGEVVLGRTINVTQLDASGLEPVIDDFAKYLMFWRENLHQLLAQAEGETADTNGDISQSFVRV